MEKIYPFKFLDSYQKEDKDFFFGRKDEIDLLYQMIFQTKILLIYGVSGTGKTSLIQCGLAGRFKSYDWLALYIRRGANLISSLDKALCFESDDAFSYVDQEEPIIKDLKAKIEAVYKASFKPIYLIFDQFEELYVLGTKVEQEYFIKTIQEILAIEQPVKIILSIREEYLGYLYEFEKEVPELLRKKLRVEPMTLDRVTDVIKGINDYKLSMVKIKTDEIEEFTEEIFERLKGKKKTLTIQLPYLQVFLDKLYIDKTKDQSHQKEEIFYLDDLKKIGDIDDVLRNFLEEQVKSISQQLSSNNSKVTSETIWKILSPFCTLEGTKEPISKMKLADRLKSDLDINLINQSVDAFTKSRILNKSEDEDLYELAHDSLALRIAEKRSEDDISKLEVKRLIKSQAAVKDEFREDFTEKQLNFIEPYYKKIVLELTEDERKLIEDSKKAIDNRRKEREQAEHRKKVKRRMVLVSIFGVISISLFFVGVLYRQSVEKNEFRDSIKPIDDLIASSEANMERAKYNVNKDPTLALQLDTAAMLSLNSAYKMLEGICNNTSVFNGTYREAEYNRLKEKYDNTASLIKSQKKSLAEADNALYKVVDPINIGITDSVLRRVLRNEIFADDSLRESEFRVWNGSSGRIDSIKNYGNLSAIVFPKNTIIAMALYSKNDTSIAGYWDSASVFRKVQNKNEGISSIAPIMYSVIKYKMLSAVKNKTIVEWDLNGTIRKSSKIPVVYKSNVKENIQIDDNIVSIAISPDRKIIFTASANGMGKIWPADVSRIKLDTSVIFNLQQDTIKCSAFSKDGSLIITGSADNSAKIWGAVHGNLIKVLNGHTGPVNSVAFSANGNFVYTGSLDGTYRQWQVPKVDPQSQMPPTKWNKTKDFDSLFIMKIIEPDPAKPKSK